MTAAHPGVRTIDLGLVDYLEAHRQQQALVEKRIAGEIEDTLLLLEHPHVFTRGRKARDASNILAAGDVPVVAVERGGDVTYHGPGQVVAYPIFQLVEGERDAPAFIRRLESWVIAGLKRVGIDTADRRRGYAGVWCGEQKIASVGVAVTAQWVTWHGIAINVEPDLSYFSRINPCGMAASVMTSVVDLTGQPCSVETMKRALSAEMSEHLRRTDLS
ncbi:MAG: lipoate-protein ligase B [Myxococcota bacterium]